MKLEITVPEIREPIDKIRQEAEILFDMIRVNEQIFLCGWGRL